MSSSSAIIVGTLLVLVATAHAYVATMTINSFEEGGDGGGPSECDGQYHSNNERIVALSTRWYSGGSRCEKYITIHGNGRSTTAKVVDECDSNNGCGTSIVDASAAVWNALAIYGDQRGSYQVTWFDASGIQGEARVV